MVIPSCLQNFIGVSVFNMRKTKENGWFSFLLPLPEDLWASVKEVSCILGISVIRDGVSPLRRGEGSENFTHFVSAVNSRDVNIPHTQTQVQGHFANLSFELYAL